MNIMFIHAGAELYGADKILLELIRSMLALGHRAFVCLPEEGPLCKLLEEAGADVFIFEFGVLRKKYFHPVGLASRAYLILKGALAVARLARKFKIDVIHSNTSVVMAGALAARVLRIPHVWHIHEITQSPRIVALFLAKLFCIFSDKVICVSNAVRDNLELLAKDIKHKAIVIYNGIEPQEPSAGARERIRRELSIPEDAILVGMVGRLNSWKGQAALLEAAHLIVSTSNESKNIYFCMVGSVYDGEEHIREKLHARIVEHNLTSITRVLDFRKDVPDILAAYDIFVLPSTQPDPFPTVVLEAMQAGLPVAAFRHGGVVEMIEHGHSGTLVPAIDVPALSRTIAMLASNSDLRATLGQLAKARVEKHFSSASFSKGFDDVYKSAIVR